MSEQKDPNMEIEALSDDDLESVSGGIVGFKANTSGGGTCNTTAGTCTTSVGSTCNTSGTGTCTNQ